MLRGAPNVVTIQSGWRDDVLSFIERVNSEMPEVDEPLIIESAEVWDRVIRTRGHMTLIPMFERPDVATAIQRGHHVVLVAGGDEHVRGEKIETRSAASTRCF